MNDLYLVSPIPVSVNHYVQSRGILVHGKVIVTVYETAEARAYKASFAEYVREEVKKQGFQKIENPDRHCAVDCNFYFARKRTDANNHWKCLLDAITESQAVWVDDKQVCERVNFVRFDPENPRVEIHIHPVEYIGIFDTTDEFHTFQSHCQSCSRYRDGRCSILLKATEGKIQPEIQGLECHKYKQRSS